MKAKEYNEKTECFSCVHKRKIPWDCHIACAKPDPKMEGHPHGIRKGWFMYPINFDPCWKLRKCANFQEK